MAQMDETLPDIACSDQSPLICHSKQRVYVKYRRPITKIILGITNYVKNYAVVSQDFWSQFGEQILKAFEIDINIAIDEKRKFGHSFMRVLNQDMIKDGGLPMIPRNANNYQGFVRICLYFVFTLLKKNQKIPRLCHTDLRIFIYCALVERFF